MTAETDSKAPSASQWLDARVQAGAPKPRAAARELPRVPRRYGQWAAAGLFIVIAVLMAGWLWQQKSDRVEALALAHAVSAGSVIERSDLKVIEVAGVDGALGSGDVDTVVGSTAAVELVPGQILNRAMLATAPVPGPGERVVGVQLDATRAPSGLAPGDVVRVLAVPAAGDTSSPDRLGSPGVLADGARVVSVDYVEGAGTGLNLLVPQERADQVASFGAAGRVALVQAPVGGDG
ncbi:MAG: hypothetical protein JWO11_1961 [Nocardioides sp.]|nr:hypothetical protein [Nocardioides sp.]